VDTIFSATTSGNTFSSISTAPGTALCFQRILAILLNDPLLKELYVEVSAKTTTEKFSRNFVTLLKKFSVEIEKEAKCWNEQ
jgi:hypothetical protein